MSLLFLSTDDNSTLDILHLTSNIQQLTFNIQIKEKWTREIMLSTRSISFS